MLKRFGISMVVVGLASLTLMVAAAFGWHANGVSVIAACDTSTYNYVLTAAINQSQQWPGAVVKSVTPSVLPGNTVGSTSVKVVIGWPNSSDTQVFDAFVATDGKCVAPPAPKVCPPGYTQDAGSTPDMLLCTNTVTNTITNTVSGPERIVDRPVPGATVYVDKLGPERIVEKLVAGPKRIIKVFGTPKCLKTEKTIKVGKGMVRCQVTKTKVIERVRVVKTPKPAYTK